MIVLHRYFLQMMQFKLHLFDLYGIWGGRIRTCEWRSQSPLPYRLATPQYLNYLIIERLYK